MSNVEEIGRQWADETVARKDDETRAQAAGLGVDPAWLAARERVARVEWIEVGE